MTVDPSDFVLLRRGTQVFVGGVLDFIFCKRKKRYTRKRQSSTVP